MRTASLIIKDTKAKGRGVFTKAPIPTDTIIEEAPVIVLSSKDRMLLDKTLLHDYIFEWNPDGKQMCCMALGWVPLYNHSNTSNCEYFMNYNDETISLKTVRDIKKGEELTINYNGDWNDPKTVWFDLRD